MSYKNEKIKEGITLHQIKNEKFKTNLYAVFLAIPLSRETVTLNALITAVLRRGSKNFKSQKIINQELENMYGANFNCGIEKSGDNHILKFYLESLNEEFLSNSENLSKKCFEILFDIIFNPLIENEDFKKEYIEGEKENLKHLIEAKIDNKSMYAYDRCIEEMFKEEPYGLYRFGYIEDLENINEKELYKYYQKLINTCKIDIFCSGNIEYNKIKKEIIENDNIKKLEPRQANYVINEEKNEKNNPINVRSIEDSMQVTQGKLVMGLKVNSKTNNYKYIVSVYNAILGGGANSKLFQNVREKQSLAYTAGSNFLRTKNAVFIKLGIEIDKYEKVIKTIKDQLEDLKKGNFTEEDIKNAKELIISSIENINEEQDSQITYYYGQELSTKFTEIEKYKDNILRVTKKEIIEIANEIQINTIYFLKN